MQNFLPDIGSRAIISPKNFKVIREGWKLGLQYIIINELKGEYEFLKNNQCSIHEIKPLDCKEFPYERIGKPEKIEQALKICKGFKRI